MQCPPLESPSSKHYHHLYKCLYASCMHHVVTVFGKAIHTQVLSSDKLKNTITK
jgi:hypothetical protein